jgi:hypothetical protein
MSDTSEKTGFIPYPNDKLCGILDTEAAVQAAVRDLQAAGFSAEEVGVLAGAEGERRIDPTGQEHGPAARLLRFLQRAGDDESKHSRIYEQAMEAGHLLVGVTAKSEEDREKARGILKSHGGHFINFYGHLAIQRLDP